MSIKAQSYIVSAGSHVVKSVPDGLLLIETAPTTDDGIVRTAWNSAEAQVRLYRKPDDPSELDSRCLRCTITSPTPSTPRLTDSEVHVQAGNPEIELTVTVPVATSILTALTERAHREGREVEAVIVDALQAAA